MGRKARTSKRVASKAARFLRGKRTAKTVKSISGSALTQKTARSGTFIVRISGAKKARRVNSGHKPPKRRK